jgi:hypothetical protein
LVARRIEACTKTDGLIEQETAYQGEGRSEIGITTGGLVYQGSKANVGHFHLQRLGHLGYRLIRRIRNTTKPAQSTVQYFFTSRNIIG